MESDRQLTAWRPETWPVAADWQPLVSRFLSSEPGQNLGRFVKGRLENGATIYPPAPLRALALTPLERVKVVILGQDPYHGPGQAHGLAFSVRSGVRIPPSLRNIQKEISRDSGLAASDALEPENFLKLSPGLFPPTGQAHLQGPGGVLEHWARQGVLLLNTCLTVEDGEPASHVKRGWEVLTDNIIKAVWENQPCAVFMLWGAHAQSKKALLGGPGKSHLVLSANHPSPLSALRPPVPFIGCGHFGRANAHLAKNHLAPVVW